MTESLFLFVYPPSDPSLNSDNSSYQEMEHLYGGDFANMNAIKINLPDIHTQGIAYRAGLWVKPVVHNGKVYSFTGTNTRNVIKILSSFRFTN